MSGKSIEERKAALKERVQSQLQASQDATEQRALVSSEELVVSVEDVDAAVELAAEKTKQRWLRLEEEESGSMEKHRCIYWAHYWAHYWDYTTDFNCK